jgi:hypothetical protein
MNRPPLGYGCRTYVGIVAIPIVAGGQYNAPPDYRFESNDDGRGAHESKSGVCQQILGKLLANQNKQRADGCKREFENGPQSHAHILRMTVWECQTGYSVRRQLTDSDERDAG